VYFGSTINTMSDPAFMALKAVTAHVWHPSYDPADVGSGYDIGLLQIEDTGPVTPKRINRSALAGMVGQPVRLVGFGDTTGSGMGGGAKRQASTSLSNFDSRIVLYGETGGNTCQGDSGGPNYMTIGGHEVVIGVTSFGDPGCAAYGAGTRVDAYQAFVDPWVEAHDTITCGLDGGCASSCGGVVDPDCPCAADGLCTAACTTSNDPDCPLDCSANGTCVTTGCPVSDPDCASCGEDGSCKSGCDMPDPDCPVGVGVACEAGPDCLSGQCLPDPQDSNVSFCTTACNADGTGCPEGMACAELGGTFYCVWEGVAPGAVGHPCSAGEECASGICDEFGEERLCTARCDETYQCREGWECEATEDGSGICVPVTEEMEPPKDEGGCRIGRGRGGIGGVMLVLLVCGGFVVSRRRRARRPDPSPAGW
jgi:hypothetical protein